MCLLNKEVKTILLQDPVHLHEALHLAGQLLATVLLTGRTHHQVLHPEVQALLDPVRQAEVILHLPHLPAGATLLQVAEEVVHHQEVALRAVHQVVAEDDKLIEN